MKKPVLLILLIVLAAGAVAIAYFALKSNEVIEPVAEVAPSVINEEETAHADYNMCIEIVPSSEDPQDYTLFLSLGNGGSAEVSDRTVRKAILMKAIEIYNHAHPGEQLSCSDAGIERFTQAGRFGFTLSRLGKYLGEATPAETDGEELTLGPGLPVPDVVGDSAQPNDFQIWCKAIVELAGDGDDIATAGTDPEDMSKVRELLKDPTVIVKASPDTPYTKAQAVFENLQAVSLTKFSLITYLK